MVVTPARERERRAGARGAGGAKLSRKKRESTPTSTAVKYLKPNVKIFKYTKRYIFLHIFKYI